MKKLFENWREFELLKEAKLPKWTPSAADYEKIFFGMEDEHWIRILSSWDDNSGEIVRTRRRPAGATRTRGTGRRFKSNWVSATPEQNHMFNNAFANTGMFDHNAGDRLFYNQKTGNWAIGHHDTKGIIRIPESHMRINSFDIDRFWNTAPEYFRDNPMWNINNRQRRVIRLPEPGSLESKTLMQKFRDWRRFRGRVTPELTPSYPGGPGGAGGPSGTPPDYEAPESRKEGESKEEKKARERRNKEKRNANLEAGGERARYQQYLDEKKAFRRAAIKRQVAAEEGMSPKQKKKYDQFFDDLIKSGESDKVARRKALEFLEHLLKLDSGKPLQKLLARFIWLADSGVKVTKFGVKLMAFLAVIITILWAGAAAFDDDDDFWMAMAKLPIELLQKIIYWVLQLLFGDNVAMIFDQNNIEMPTSLVDLKAMVEREAHPEFLKEVKTVMTAGIGVSSIMSVVDYMDHTTAAYFKKEFKKLHFKYALWNNGWGKGQNDPTRRHKEIDSDDLDSAVDWSDEHGGGYREGSAEHKEVLKKKCMPYFCTMESFKDWDPMDPRQDELGKSFGYDITGWKEGVQDGIRTKIPIWKKVRKIPGERACDWLKEMGELSWYVSKSRNPDCSGAETESSSSPHAGTREALRTLGPPGASGGGGGGRRFEESKKPIKLKIIKEQKKKTNIKSESKKPIKLKILKESKK
jgi:hypothetical protein